MKLVDNASQWWRMASVRGLLVLAAWNALPPPQQAELLNLVFGNSAVQPFITPVLALVTIYLRLVKQPSVSGEAP